MIKRKLFDNGYRELTPLAMLVGIFLGVLMTASFTYAALILGFSTVGSAVAAILGWGILKVIFKKGTIVENNIVQTIASGINTTTAGVVFTVPVLLIRGIQFDMISIGAACVAGAFLGIGLIIPLRKQMIDIERLRFPSGTAVASILVAPSEGVKKSRLLLTGAAIAGALVVLTSMQDLGLPEILPKSIDLANIVGFPGVINATMALSLLGLGIGFIAGRNGLFVLAGGLLAYWIITPVVASLGWVPAELSKNEMVAFVHNKMTRPMGIGMLVGGSIMGILLAFPAIKAALTSLKNSTKLNNKSGAGDELSLNVIYVIMAIALIVLFVSTLMNSTVGVGLAFAIAVLGVLWLWFAGIIVSQATGMTDWTPISGMALLAVVLLLFIIPEDQITAAVLIGSTVSVAIAECSDMMQDLKTGHLVGSLPFKQEAAQLMVAWIGPIVSLTVMMLIWNSGGTDPLSGQHLPGFGPGTNIEAPQASALGMTIDSVVGGDIPMEKFAIGGILGVLLSLAGIPGLGVIMGISMYLSIKYILPYGIGSLISIYMKKKKGFSWIEDKGIPFASGLVVGEALLIIIFALIKIAGASV